MIRNALAYLILMVAILLPAILFIVAGYIYS